MQKILPAAVRQLDAVPKIVWLYIDRYPGQYSVRSLQPALGCIRAAPCRTCSKRAS